jgi:hypothetical protein
MRKTASIFLMKCAFPKCVLTASSGDLGKAVSELVTVMTDEDQHSESASPSDEELHTSARFSPK